MVAAPSPPVAHPATLAEASALLRAGGRLRPRGAGRSTPALLHTDTIWVSGDGLTACARGDDHTVRVGGGVSIGALGAWLAERGLRLPSVGTSAYPTVGGATGTGLHGSGHATGSLCDEESLVGMTLVTPSGDVVALHDGRAADRALLQAARLHLGAFGLVAEVVLRTTPGATLRRTTTPVALDTLLDPELPRSADHVEAWWVPHTEDALLITRHPVQTPPPRGGRLRQALGRGLTEDLPLRAMIEAQRHHPALAPRMARLLARFGRAAGSVVGRWDRLTLGPRWLDAVDLEVALPVDQLAAGLAAIRAVADRAPLHLPIHIRWGRADRGVLLSPAAGRDTVWLDIAWHRAMPGGDPVLASLDQALAALGGRPHWGKLAWANPSHRFPGLDAWRTAQASVDPNGALLNEHLRRLLDGRPLREAGCTR